MGRSANFRMGLNKRLSALGAIDARGVGVEKIFLVPAQSAPHLLAGFRG